MGIEAAIVLEFDKGALAELSDGEGLGALRDHLQAALERARPGDFEIVPASGASGDGQATRGGEVEIISAVAALITAATPLVVAYFRSRGFEVEITTETRKNGTTIQRQKIRRGLKP